MKKFLSFVFLVSLIVSCALMKDKNLLTGDVEAIEYGKDGYTAKIKTAKKEIYLATISRVNLVDSQDYKVFKIGEKVTLKGEFWKSDTEKHIKVTDIVLR
ncbi:hypothetical protein EOD40_03970 [Flavobacterium sufflavum]|uniref:DUF3221 domain-containing protein n=1 Tax=Flavobacterium sufflavum TaxID=1921138 RepID=A0A3S2XKR3_9FLAO|nr:hypothetical protein [Flavobacterium sufflavum]RVT78401.1 hypothetical protein EOD40_03970 [Flavobacterium sufflavum]